MSIRIIGTGSGLPSHKVSNDDLAQFLDTSDEWITSRTGIGGRQVATTESLCDIATTAATNALQAAGVTADQLDLILCATLQGDYITPSLGCMVQQQLGADCTAMDINAACSGFLYALDVADSYIASGKASRVLVVAAEMMSKLVDWQDRATCVLFGDGAGACVVTAGDSLRYIRLMSAGNVDPLNLAGRSSNFPAAQPPATGQYLQMDGQEVFKFAVTTVGREIKKALQAVELTAEDIDLYLLHQANKRIIESVRTRLGIGESRFPTNIERLGNCSSASIPMLLDELVRSGSITEGSRLLLTGFGAGMTAGTAVLYW